MKNISGPFLRLGVSRQHYYGIKNTLAKEGVKRLVEKISKVAPIYRGKNLRLKQLDESVMVTAEFKTQRCFHFLMNTDSQFGRVLTKKLTEYCRRPGTDHYLPPDISDYTPEIMGFLSYYSDKQ